MSGAQIPGMRGLGVRPTSIWSERNWESFLQTKARFSLTFHISPPGYWFDTKILFSAQLEYFSHMLLCVTFEL